MNEYLQPTEFLDFDQKSVRDFAETNTVGAKTEKEKAVALYRAVRDGFQYNPYLLDLRRTGLTASDLLTRNHGYCVEKAVLLAASARAVGVPSRLSFYIVRNHIATGKLEKALKKDYLVFHGAAEMFLEGRWLKTTPAFNAGLCKYLGVEPLEFDGRADSIFQEYDRQGNVFMEYLHDYGAFSDLPYELYLEELGKHYPHIFGNENYTTGDLVYDFTK
ncbi:MAG TPA: transglutaminase family protein [Pyrinomonadaceae bacterium]|nr:transglutaminase family protein [Pyrinomonadaceae bacterium]